MTKCCLQQLFFCSHYPSIEMMTHLSDAALPFKVHLVICPLKQPQLKRKTCHQICSLSVLHNLLNSKTKTSSRNRQKHVIRSIFFHLCTICPIWKSLNLPAKGQVGPDPPSPFYFFGQASCARIQSL